MIKKQFSIGLLDKDAHKQLVATSDAMRTITNLVIKHFWYGTIYNASWVYTHDDGTLVVEPSVIVDIITDKPHTLFVQDVKQALNQESVMYMEQPINVEFL